jgi:hypothetical protein
MGIRHFPGAPRLDPAGSGRFGVESIGIGAGGGNKMAKVNDDVYAEGHGEGRVCRMVLATS